MPRGCIFYLTLQIIVAQRVQTVCNILSHVCMFIFKMRSCRVVHSLETETGKWERHGFSKLADHPGPSGWSYIEYR